MQIENLHNSIFYANIFICLTFFRFHLVAMSACKVYIGANLFRRFMCFFLDAQLYEMMSGGGNGEGEMGKRTERE